jgi:CheY-like chemotaxis protein
MSLNAQGGKREKPPMATLPLLRERDERLESLKALAGHLVHDFNNFLSPVFGYLTLIKEERPPTSVLNYADMMEKSARRIEGVMDTALLAARPQRSFRPEKTDFNDLVESELREWLESLPGTARITLKKDLAPCELEIDPVQWRHVVQHLLHNARFALVTGGNLEVSLQPCQLTAARSAELGLATVDFFRLEFRDFGFGMSEATLKRACEPFFTTRPKGQALGLGLTIVHGVTRLHGGQLLIESAEDAGTTVSIFLPTAPATYQPAADVAAGRPMLETRGMGRKILLVDDDPMVREVIKACLQREKYDVYVAPDGVEGLKLFSKHQRHLALVLSDVTMPNMDGIELTHKIRAQNAEIPILLISGDTDFTVQQGLASLGSQAPELIKKPFTVKGLMEVVKKYLS